jgi:purine-nucleoside phosphorylase
MQDITEKRFIMSMHISAPNRSDIAESVLLPGDPLRAKFIAETFLEEPVCYNEIRGMLGFTGRYRGVPVSVQGSGMGMPSIGIYSWELITEYDVKNLIRIGTAGTFDPKLKLRDVVLALSASTDSNYVHTFELNGQYAPTASWTLVRKALSAAERQGIEMQAGNVLSSDVFYEVNPDWWKKWASMGVLCVEMEAAALYMNATRGGANALAILTLSDHFITGEKASAEDRQTSFTAMIELALETATA